MPSVDSRPQAFNSHPPPQLRPEDEAVNNFIPATSANNYVLQDGSFLSAEPSMIDYSMTTFGPSGTSAQDPVFTPNTVGGTSFDSSLQFNQSYPPTGLSMHTPTSYSLSPAPHSRTGQSISPSHSVDNFSPEAAYMSDSNYQPLSTFTSPGGQFIDESYSNIPFSDPNGNAFESFPNDMGIHLPMTAESLNTIQAQSQAVFTGPVPTGQLMSPCTTNNSSPMIPEEMQRNMHVYGAQYPANDYQTSTPPAHAPQTAQSTPQRQQHSPALTNSPSGANLANAQQRSQHLTSPRPRVFVQHISGEESPSHSDISRPMSKRSHGSHHSKNHLSPFPNDDSSDDDDGQVEQVMVKPVIRSTERGDDGSWLPTGGTSQSGLSPDDRQAMNDAWVPSIEEIHEMKMKEEKKADVKEWLAKSEVGSEAGDDGPSANLLKPHAFTARPRAKSTNDAHRYGLGVRGDFLRPDDSGVPGPGLYIHEPSEFDDYEDDDDYDAGPESPPAEIDFSAAQTDVSEYPPAAEDGPVTSVTIRPWEDGPIDIYSSTPYQPQTSNAAIMRFKTRAKDIESASLAATLGSRRLSESDLGSIRQAPGVIKALEPTDPKKVKQRRPSFIESFITKRTPANVLKRKQSIPVQQPPESTPDKPKEPFAEKPKRMGSWGRPKSPRLDTSVANHGVVGQPSPGNLSATSGPWFQSAKNAIRRSRSRSDLGKSPGLAELMTQHGGPPMPTLATSPLAETEPTKLSPQPSPMGDDDDDDTQEAITMDLKVRSDPIIPTLEGFKLHARNLNPRLVDYMVDRITQEQMRRYKRLLEFKVKHLNAVKNRNCASAKFCPDLGGESKQLPPRAGNKDSEAPFIGFQITAPGSSDDDGEPPPEGTVVSAQFPTGVPLPPVKRLPAEFECPLCFKVKKFYKPSDWTKHVHEDVQPFTCTFPNCGEPKSFKRKADWVRHENERHRQLENWTCQIADCNHTCYRKDNFVQHLVREHKIAEPRARTGRGGNKDSSANGDGASWQQGYPAKDHSDDIWSLVERCRQDTTKQPKDEACRFCGNICNSWKKLTVHLAKHMEQISMPILTLVEQKQMSADTIISPVVEIPESRKLSATPNRSPVDNPSRYNPNANVSPGVDQSFGQFPQESAPSAAAANMMHSYPPPQMMYKNQQPVQKPNYANFNMDGNFPGRTYPGVQDPSKARGVYMNGLQIPSQPYHNGSVQNGPNRYPMTPLSAVGQGQQPFLTSSPVDSTPFSTDTMGSTYFTQEPQNMPGNGGMGEMNFESFQQPTYQQMAYMNQPHTYQYQGQ